MFSLFASVFSRLCDVGSYPLVDGLGIRLVYDQSTSSRSVGIVCSRFLITEYSR